MPPIVLLRARIPVSALATSVLRPPARSAAAAAIPTPGRRRNIWLTPSSPLFSQSASPSPTGPARGPDSGPIGEYDRRVRAGELRDDEHQRAIIGHLQALFQQLKSYDPPAIPPTSTPNHSPAGRFFSKLWSLGRSESITPPAPPEGTPHGIYMFGHVGCGKTMLMDLFYHTLPPHLHNRRSRVHFLNFIQNVHQSLHRLKKEKTIAEGKSSSSRTDDDIDVVATDIARSAAVLCFDEFQCTNIADAMVLRRLFEALLRRGVVVVTTSNRRPDDLYKNGIQRQSFVPTIELIKKYLTVIDLDSSTDYRRVRSDSDANDDSDADMTTTVYFCPADSVSSRDAAESWFLRLGDVSSHPPAHATLSVWGRPINVPLASGRAAMFAFSDLLGAATGPADYLAICRAFDGIVVTDVPQMKFENRDVARRFITFVDAMYEAGNVLVMTTAVPVEDLFGRNEIRKSDDDDDDGAAGSTKIMDTDESFSSARALSRLAQMSSPEWINRPRE